MKKITEKHKKTCAILFLLLICQFALTNNSLFADTEMSIEYKLKANFIYNFTKFVKWPEIRKYEMQKPEIQKPDNNYVNLCILGEDPFGSSLDTIKEKKVKNKSLKISKILSHEDIQNCQILFVSQSEKKHFSDIISHCRNLPVLTIGDTPGFSNKGGIITLIRADNQLRFQINTDAAKQAEIKISSHLLKLAHIVKAPAE